MNKLLVSGALVMLGTVFVQGVSLARPDPTPAPPFIDDDG
jgi:hypothetical protein